MVGRDKHSCALVIDNSIVSRKHLAVSCSNGRLSVQDLGSSNGTFIDGKLIRPFQDTAVLSDKQVQLGDSIFLRFLNEIKINTGPKYDQFNILQILSDNDEIYIGRGLDCNLVLEDAAVSRKHARIFRKAGRIKIEDLGSTNGTYINGSRLSGQRYLEENDKVFIGLYVLSLRYSVVNLNKEQAISAEGISKVYDNGYVGLQTTSLSIPYKKMIALMGPSGCGKSTLLKALNGDSPPSFGTLKIFGLDMQHHFEMIKHIIGYVPQENIVHEELTVYESLYFAGRIRLSKDISREKIDGIIDEVLSSLNINNPVIKNTRVEKLSGGQKKRVSIAVELLSKPKILFLDEPTSPLDPETIEEFLSCIRGLSDKGTTVIMVTHKPEDLNYVDQVIFMGSNGFLSFDGRKEDLLSHYGKKSIIHIYTLLNSAKNARIWYEKWRQINNSGTKAEFKKMEVKKLSVDFFSQVFWLTSRYGRIKTGNFNNLLILIVQPFLIAFLIAVTFDGLIATNPSNGMQEPRLGVLFLMTVAAIWFGVSNSAKEIVGERSIAKREFMVNLKLDAYIISKQIVLLSITAVQVFILLAVLALFYNPDLHNIMLQFGVLSLISLCSVQYGLMLSASASTTEGVMSLLPLALMPQIILSGIIQPLENQFTILLSYLTVSRWGTELLARTQDLYSEDSLFVQFINGSLYPIDAEHAATDSVNLNIMALSLLFIVMLVVVRFLIAKRLLSHI